MLYNRQLMMYNRRGEINITVVDTGLLDKSLEKCNLEGEDTDGTGQVNKLLDGVLYS